MIKPFLKWPGGKTRVLENILAKLPQGECFVEPFVGSGVVFLNTGFRSFRLYDKNPDLIGLFQILQKKGDRFIQQCKKLFTEKNNTPEQYYAIRTMFNESKDVEERSAFFVYLNRHGFNGLVRYNNANKFNVPFGQYTAPYFPYKEMMAFFEKTTEHDVAFDVCDFESVFLSLRQGDVVYCDPPYVPLSPTAKFTKYFGAGFTFDKQEMLAKFAQRAAQKGIPVVISNHNTEETQKLYLRAKEIQTFSVQRFISCKGKSRVRAPEVLAVFM